MCDNILCDIRRRVRHTPYYRDRVGDPYRCTTWQILTFCSVVDDTILTNRIERGIDGKGGVVIGVWMIWKWDDLDM